MRNLLATALMVGTLGLGGCVVAPVDGYYGEAVPMAPPPPMVEHVGPPPVIGYVWIDGYWRWGGSRYAWVPGYWSAPRPGYAWEPHRWHHHGGSWYQQGGNWRPHGNYVDPPRRHDPPPNNPNNYRPPERPRETPPPTSVRPSERPREAPPANLGSGQAGGRQRADGARDGPDPRMRRDTQFLNEARQGGN